EAPRKLVALANHKKSLSFTQAVQRIPRVATDFVFANLLDPPNLRVIEDRDRVTQHSSLPKRRKFFKTRDLRRIENLTVDRLYTPSLAVQDSFECRCLPDRCEVAKNSRVREPEGHQKVAVSSENERLTSR